MGTAGSTPAGVRTSPDYSDATRAENQLREQREAYSTQSLEPYLVERAAEGATVLDFYHRQFNDVVTGDFLGGDEGRARHAALARHFADQDVMAPGEKEPRPSVRKLTELPYQQTMAETWDDLFATLTDFGFLERKASDIGVVEVVDAEGGVIRTHTGVYALLDDYAFALERMPGDDGQPAGPKRRPPLILTAVDTGAGPTIRCPACQTDRPVAEDERGTEIDCPNESCRRELKINPFVTRLKPPRW